MPRVNLVGGPCTGKPYARSDGGRLETGYGQDIEAPSTERDGQLLGLACSRGASLLPYLPGGQLNR